MVHRRAIIANRNQYLTNLRGIVTMEGSATAHPMLIGRERHLPVICGVPGLMKVFPVPYHKLQDRRAV